MMQLYPPKKKEWFQLFIALSMAPFFGLSAQGLHLIEAFNYESGAYIDAQQAFYAASPSSGPAQKYFNRLVKLDPKWGTVQAEIYAGLDPHFLRATTDQSALFMLGDRPNRIKRFNVATQTIDQDDPIGIPDDDIIYNLYTIPKNNEQVIIFALNDGTYYLRTLERGKPKPISHTLLPAEATFMSAVFTNDSTLWTLSPEAGTIKRLKIRPDGIHLEKTFLGYGHYILEGNFFLIGDYFVSDKGMYIRHTGEKPQIEGRLKSVYDTKISIPPGSAYFYTIEQAGNLNLNIVKYRKDKLSPIDTFTVFAFGRSQGAQVFNACTDDLFVFTSNNHVGSYFHCTPKYAKPAIAAPSPLQLCIRDTPERVLTTVEPAFKYYWLKGVGLPQEYPTFKVSEENSYRVRVSDETGCLSELSDPLVVQVITPPGKPTFYQDLPPATPLKLCKGQKVTFTVSFNPLSQTEWSTGDSTNVIEATQSGMYRVRWHANRTCYSEWSDPVEVVQIADSLPPQPIIKLLNAPSGIVCMADTLIYEAPPGYAYYDWNSTLTNSHRYKITAPTFGNQASMWVRMGNQSFCMSAASERITVRTLPRPPKPIIQRSSNVLASGNTDPNGYYDWFLNGSAIPGENKRLLVAKKEGFYSVRLRSGDCISPTSDLYSFTGLTTSSNAVGAVASPQLFPNPATEQIYVQDIAPDDPNLQVRIIDIQGRLQPSAPVQRAQGLLSLYIGHLSTGTYVLQGMSNRQSWTLRFIKI
ncbi:MAG TPA: T9SS type A sorting domain-containing protein [Haliscomenobacter sp.]|uniref:T9SS type A sorting domain-containing protein n=1 Tax=Haliscomenobacter sp. TaxID=2717303 RepID=UPI002CCB85AA|nr:T9SS type A sorting domain-containing protein [Haliscomenobacter sp.]HOY16785.1 T9SS type A sorting domain-containing protein [Haliscomenobacter sp.]